MNKVFVQHSAIHGIGIFAGVGIKKGDAFLPIDDSRLVTRDNPLREDLGECEYHCDYFINDDGKVVLMKFPERHVNHCCSPTSYFKTLNGSRYMVALRDIARGEEITWDYCISRSFPNDPPWPCDCGSSRCRRMIVPDFFSLPHGLQMAYLPLLDEPFVAVYREKIETLHNRGVEATLVATV